MVGRCTGDFLVPMRGGGRLRGFFLPGIIQSTHGTDPQPGTLFPQSLAVHPPHSMRGDGLVSVAPGTNRLYGYPPRKIPAFPGGAPQAKTPHPHPTPHMTLIKNAKNVAFSRRRSDRLNGGMHGGGRMGMKSLGGGSPLPPKEIPVGGYPMCPQVSDQYRCLQCFRSQPVSLQGGSMSVPYGHQAQLMTHENYRPFPEIRPI